MEWFTQYGGSPDEDGNVRGALNIPDTSDHSDEDVAGAVAAANEMRRTSALG